MVSERQMLANRRNALRSTGPRTAEGKEKVGLNVLEDLKRKSGLIKHNKQDVLFVLFAKRGFTPGLEEAAEEDSKILLFDFNSDTIVPNHRVRS